MKLFFENDRVKIYHADSDFVVADMYDNDQQVDITVTSPPYADLREYDGNKAIERASWEGFFQNLYGITADGGVVCWNEWDKIENYAYNLDSIEHMMMMVDCGFINHERIIWNKMSASFTNQSRYFSSYEYVWIMSKGKPKIVNLIKDIKIKHKTNHREHRMVRYKDGKIKKEKRTRMPDSDYRKRDIIWNIPPVSTEKRNESTREHPARFPVKLPEGCILTWSKEGDTVFDPFMGSGTTGVAAIKNGRKFIGIDISEKYCEMARDRILSLSELSNTKLIE